VLDVEGVDVEDHTFDIYQRVIVGLSCSCSRSAWLMQPGEYILREGALLETDSRFFIIEEGTVECRKTLQAMLAHLPRPQHPVHVRILLNS
jgi:hypothetical protein